jgi:hypothetical protein
MGTSIWEKILWRTTFSLKLIIFGFEYVCMKLSRILILFYLLLSTWLYAQESKEIDWDYEINLLARELSEKHPDLFFKTDSSWYFNEMRQLARDAPGKSIFQVSVRLQQVIAAMGDAQTQINYHFLIRKSHILPFECYWFEDGIFILEADRMYEALLGKKLSAINQTPIGVVIDSLSSLLVKNNQSSVKNQVPRMLTWFQLLEYYGFVSGDSLSLTVCSSSGESTDVIIRLPVETGEMLELQAKSLPLGWEDQKSFFRDNYMETENLYYIQYNRCWSREVEEEQGSGASALFMPSFKEFEKEVFRILKKKKIDKLVFDLRFNRGGYAPQGTEFIKKICKTLPREHGNIFLLLGRTNRASAIINTLDFMNHKEVILVGEETGGRPNHFGDVRRFVLPESKLIVSHSTRYFKLLEEDLPGITPDLLTPIYYDSYINGIDPALEAVRLFTDH